jgi:thiol-disulfide isomerase/thioredoxin
MAAASMLLAQAPPANQTIRAIRLKISAGDLPSAESLLERHKAEKGADTEYIVGVSWLARGAALTGDWPAAERYAKLTLELCGDPKDPDLIYAAGSALEVTAQALEAIGKKDDAIAFLDKQLQARSGWPLGFRSRLYKRRNQIGLVGQPAPPIEGVELQGKPTVLFLWANYCGDCLAQAPALELFWKNHGPKGVRVVAVTRIYEDDADADRKKTADVWKASYSGLSDVPVVISTEAMLRYGGSSTPTFVFIDSKGIVRAYLPYRLTADRLAAEANRLVVATN